MATNKAKRSIHQAQDDPKAQRLNLNPQPSAGLMPVKAATYRALAELNTGFDKVLHELGSLRHVDFLRSGTLADMRGQLLVMRARANHEFLSLMSDREAANAGHFERLGSERGPGEPAGS